MDLKNKQHRDEVVRYLKGIKVEAEIGANLVAISNAINALGEVKEEKVEVTNDTPTT